MCRMGFCACGMHQLCHLREKRRSPLSLYWIINSISLHLWDLLKQAFFSLLHIKQCMCVCFCICVHEMLITEQKEIVQQLRQRHSNTPPTVTVACIPQGSITEDHSLCVRAACERTCAACVSKSYLNMGWIEEHLSWSRKKKRTFAHAHTEAGFHPGGKSSMTVFGIDQRRMCNPLYGCLFRRFQSVLYFAVCLVVTFRVSVACKVIIQTIKPASFVSHTEQWLCVCVCLCLRVLFGSALFTLTDIRALMMGAR